MPSHMQSEGYICPIRPCGALLQDIAAINLVDLQTNYYLSCVSNSLPSGLINLFSSNPVVKYQKSSYQPYFLCLMPVLLSGCSRAPLQDVLGSFFPSWMLCGVFGVVASALLRAVIGAFGVNEAVPVPVLTYIAFALAATFLTWLLIFGH